MVRSSAGHGKDRKFRFLWIYYVATVGWCSKELFRVSHRFGYMIIVDYRYALRRSLCTLEQSLSVANFYPITEFKF